MGHECSIFCQEFGCEKEWGEKMSSFTSGVNSKEPPPKKNDSKPIWEMVIEDMKERDQVGEARYGTKLQKFNGRNSAVDAYQEGLDLVVYLRQLIEERKEMVKVLNYYAKQNDRDQVDGSEARNLLKKIGEL